MTCAFPLEGAQGTADHLLGGAGPDVFVVQNLPGAKRHPNRQKIFRWEWTTFGTKRPAPRPSPARSSCRSSPSSRGTIGPAVSVAVVAGIAARERASAVA